MPRATPTQYCNIQIRISHQPDNGCAGAISSMALKMEAYSPGSSFMKSNTEERRNPLPEQETQLWNFFLLIGVQSAEELRSELGLDELNFRHLGPNLNREPKRYFLYRVLDE